MEDNAIAETVMRLIQSIPFLSFVILVYLLLVQSGSMLQPDSTFYDALLPSGTEVFFLVGDVFIVAGLAALFIEIIKSGTASAMTLLDHVLSVATLIAAVICFLLVPACGTASFFILTVMALVDVLAGFAVSFLAARRDIAVG